MEKAKRLPAKYVSSSPSETDQDLKKQILELIVSGGQVTRRFAVPGIANAERLGFLTLDKTVVACCCLKNPTIGYKEGVFGKAKAVQNPTAYLFELGYIVTHKEYEGFGYCQDLLGTFISEVNASTMYATTRKPSMVHILTKYGFYKSGQIYQGELQLMLFDPRE